MQTLTRQLTALERRVIYVLDKFKGGINIRKLYKIFYHLQQRGGKVHLTFNMNPIYSPELDEVLEKLEKKGFIKKLYLLTGEYIGLYTCVVMPSEKCIKAMDKISIPSKDKDIIDSLIEELKSKRRGNAGKNKR